jgi:hypothetical protein
MKLAQCFLLSQLPEAYFSERALALTKDNLGTIWTEILSSSQVYFDFFFFFCAYP